MDVKLVMFKANGQRRDFPVRGEKLAIGRATEADLQIPLGTVSRRHCEILIEDGDVIVRDTGSSNGTYVNDKRVQEIELSPGDKLTVGPVIFTVVIDGEPEEIKPVRTVIVEHAVEPVSQAERDGDGTVDVEAELEEIGDQPQDPLSALQSMSKPKE